MLTHRNDPSDKFVIVHVTSGDSTFSYEISGERKYQDALRIICCGFGKDRDYLDVEAYLVPTQSHSIAVMVHEKIVGYIPDNDCKTFRQKLRRIAPPNAIVQVDAKITGGWFQGCCNVGSFRVKLDLPST